MFTQLQWEIHSVEQGLSIIKARSWLIRNYNVSSWRYFWPISITSCDDSKEGRRGNCNNFALRWIITVWMEYFIVISVLTNRRNELTLCQSRKPAFCWYINPHQHQRNYKNEYIIYRLLQAEEKKNGLAAVPV